MAINVNFDPEKGMVETLAPSGQDGALAVNGAVIGAGVESGFYTINITSGSGEIASVNDLDPENVVIGMYYGGCTVNSASPIKWTKVGSIVTLSGFVAITTTTTSSQVVITKFPTGVAPDADNTDTAVGQAIFSLSRSLVPLELATSVQGLGIPYANYSLSRDGGDEVEGLSFIFDLSFTYRSA